MPRSERSQHSCNPRCFGTTHFDIVYLLTDCPKLTVDMLLATAPEYLEILACKEILEYPAHHPDTGEEVHAAFSITFKWSRYKNA